MIINYVSICETGNKREINQDAVLAKANDSYGLFVVADGMGGHSHGEVASSSIVNNMSVWWNSFVASTNKSSLSEIMRSIGRAVESVNYEIHNSTSKNVICGSTVVILFVCDEGYGILYAGDSRIYLNSNNRLSQITKDETWENQPGNTLNDRQKKKHPYYGRLINAIGIDSAVRFSVKTDILQKKMIFALCSDGIYKYADRKVFEKVLKHTGVNQLEKSCNDIKDNVYSNGANDNLSLIIVGVEQK